MRPQWPSRKTAFLLCMRNTRRWKAHWMPSRSPINIPQTASSSRPTPFPSSHGTSIQASKKTLAERYAVIVATVGVTFFLAVFLALFIYRSIVRNVVDPIKRLNNCMLDRVNRIPTPFPESVRYELAEMTSSVRYFTSEIEKHEQELLHSHENLEKQVAERTCELKALSEKLLMAQESERFRARLRAARQHRGHARRDQVRHGAFPFVPSVPCPSTNSSRTSATRFRPRFHWSRELATHLRRIQNELRPPQLELGLEATIADFCEEYERVFAHMPVGVPSRSTRKLPPNSPMAIFRIIWKPSATSSSTAGRPAPPFPSAWTATPSGSSSAMTERAFRSRKARRREREVRPWPQEPPRACTAQFRCLNHRIGAWQGDHHRRCLGRCRVAPVDASGGKGCRP